MDISLALGGGGAKGNAHVGVLRCLEREGFRIRAIAGTSFGGIVAALYAAGYAPAEIEEQFCRVDQSKLYGRQPTENPSLMGLAGVSRWLDDVVDERTFEDLKLPCALTAVDLKSAREIILTEGYLKDAILATIALPGIFPSHLYQDYELVDGGVLDPVPVGPARRLAPHLPVVAVVLSTPISEPTHALPVTLTSVLPAPLALGLNRLRITQALNTFLRSVDIGNRLIAELRLEADAPEVVVRPEVDDVQLLERVDVKLVAQLGDQAVEKALPELHRAVSWPSRLRRRWFGAGA
jgi:NTE family protein